MNLVPSIPKGSFGRSFVGRDGVPNRLFRVFIYRSHSILYINLFITSLCITCFICQVLTYNFTFRTTDLLKLV